MIHIIKEALDIHVYNMMQFVILCQLISPCYYQSLYNKLIFHFSSKIKKVLA